MLSGSGGPGCSSLAGGFLSELGPYYPTNEPGGLQRNEFAWTQAANVIFLESPAFVGWSYSNTSADAVVGAQTNVLLAVLPLVPGSGPASPHAVCGELTSMRCWHFAGDKRTAADTYVFLEGFLERFPAYVGREFWIAGESYGGHYVRPHCSHRSTSRTAACQGHELHMLTLPTM